MQGNQDFKQHSESFSSYHRRHWSIYIIIHFIQCKKRDFAPFNAVIGVMNLALHLYAKLETGNQATLAQTSFNSQ